MERGGNEEVDLMGRLNEEIKLVMGGGVCEGEIRERGGGKKRVEWMGCSCSLLLLAATSMMKSTSSSLARSPFRHVLIIIIIITQTP